jgi:hypothetical protein
MAEEYNFTTIKDIFLTVPIDKIPACLKELGVLMVQAKGMGAAMCAAAEVMAGERPPMAFEWPEPITWIDDDKGEVQARYMMPGNDSPLFETKTVVNR